MEYEVKTLDDGIGFVSHTEDGYPMLSTYKDMWGKGMHPKIGLSLCSGCGVKCVYCFTNGYQRFRKLTSQEIVSQAHMVFDYCNERKWLDHLGEFGIEDGFICPQHEIKLSLKQMGDPLLNPVNTMDAIISLGAEYPQEEIGTGAKKPYATFVVSTSGPKLKSNKEFFKRLNEFNDENVRLQFSCHTTSDKEREILSPKIPMMTLKEIAKIANKFSSPVTINLVMFKGYTYSVQKMRDLFDKYNTHIKINYIDDNRYIKSFGLKDMSYDEVNKFTNKLGKYGFSLSSRIGPCKRKKA